MNDRFTSVAVLAIALLTCSQPVSALPLGFGTGCAVNGSSGAAGGSPDALVYDTHTLSGGCGGGQARSTGTVGVPVRTDNGLSIHTFTQLAETSASARAGLGGLGVLSSSSASSTPQAYLYLLGGAGHITENFYAARGNSSALSYWHDLLTVGGTPNANGFVVLNFSLDLHGQTFASLFGASGARILSRFFYDDGFRFLGHLELTQPGTISQTIGFLPGQQVQLRGDLHAMTGAFAGRSRPQADYVSSSNAVADAWNSADFHIDVLTPGGSYSTLSGASYLTGAVNQVPEPSTWILFASGLLVVGWLTNRRAGGWREIATPTVR